MCTKPNTCFLGPTRVRNPNSVSIGSAIFAQLTAVLYGMPWHDLSPKNCPLAWSDLDRHLTHGSLGPPEYRPQTTSFCRAHYCDRPTDRPTDYATRSVRIGHICIHSTVMRPIVTDRVAWSVGRSICHSNEPYKKMLSGVWSRVGPRRHVLNSGPDRPMPRGNF